MSVLFREWSELEQGDDESFDAYRARVNNVANLLGNADERPSARMYAYTLLERLRPHYKPVVLALQNSSLMKKTKTIAVPKVEKTELDIDWIEVTRQVNAHERSEQRQCENEDRQSSGGAMSAVRAYSATQQRTGRDKNASTIRNGAWQQPGEQCRDLPAWNSQGQPRCFNCNQYGHIGKDCTRPRRTRNSRWTEQEEDARSEQEEGTVEAARAAVVQRTNYSNYSDLCM